MIFIAYKNFAYMRYEFSELTIKCACIVEWAEKFKNVKNDKFKDDLYYLLSVNIVLARINVTINST